MPASPLTEQDVRVALGFKTMGKAELMKQLNLKSYVALTKRLESLIKKEMVGRVIVKGNDKFKNIRLEAN